MIHTTSALTVILLAALLTACNHQGNAPAHSNSANADNHSQPGMTMMQSMDVMMQRMDNIKMTGDVDLDFANMMIEHHQGAIEMSRMEIQHGMDAQMKAMAGKIIAAQEMEIAKLRAFTQDHHAPPGHAHQMPATSMQAMHQQMKAMSMSGQVDRDFATMMKIHHQGAVTMAQEEIAKGQHIEVKLMAEQMIADQQREIAEFQAWLDKNR